MSSSRTQQEAKRIKQAAKSQQQNFNAKLFFLQGFQFCSDQNFCVFCCYSLSNEYQTLKVRLPNLFNVQYLISCLASTQVTQPQGIPFEPCLLCICLRLQTFSIQRPGHEWPELRDVNEKMLCKLFHSVIDQIISR